MGGRDAPGPRRARRRLAFALVALLVPACASRASARPERGPGSEPEAGEAGPLGAPTSTPRPRKPAEPDTLDRAERPDPDSVAAARAAAREAEAAKEAAAKEAAAKARAEAENRKRDRPARAGTPDLPVLPGALLPRERIVAFYGTPRSTRMGILGELPPDAMLDRLDGVVASWEEADPETPVRPALQVIASMATGDPGADSLYRLRLSDSQIAKVKGWAERRNALLILDVQTGRSSVGAELPRLAKWLERPDVHLALDPEWSMPGGGVPGKRIGSLSAADVNTAIEFLARIVEEHDLPPKLLVVHRFTTGMLRHARDIRIDPRVQVVIDMDGWGPPAQKLQVYRQIVAPEAEQYLGLKLFFRNDRRNGSRMLTPDELLGLDPVPLYIQYQ